MRTSFPKAENAGFSKLFPEPATHSEKCRLAVKISGLPSPKRQKADRFVF